MLKNYIVILLRNIRKHKGYFFINIFGLALGLTCSLLILLVVQDELSYDKFHSNSEHLFRVEQDQVYNGRLYHVNVTPWPCVPSWVSDIPEIKAATRYGNCGGGAFRNDNISFIENDVQAVDPDFFTIFDFPLISGDRHTVMDDPYSVVINEETAIKYFGEENPMGRKLVVDNQYSLTVTGVLETPPQNSTFRPVILVTMEFSKVLGRYSDNWGSNSIRSYLLLYDDADLAEVNRKLTEVVNNHRDVVSPTKFMAAPLTSVHLHAYFGFNDNGQNIVYVYIFSIIAGFVLLIACINFMNLATARSASRAREIGIRKVIGAHRKNLIFQFISESIILSFLALLVSLVFVLLLLPVFNNISGKMIEWSALLQTNFLLGLTIITLLTGIIAGSYPALFLSAFKPIKVLKGNLAHGRSQILRKVSVIIQFTLSISLTIGTVIIYQQLKFMQSKDLGFNEKRVVSIGLPGDKEKNYKVLKQELLHIPEVLNISASSNRPTMIGSNSSGADWDGKDPDLGPIVSYSTVDFDYVETMEIQMIAGRPFALDFPSDAAHDSVGAFMINEEFARIINKEIIINENLRFLGIEGPIIGVMRNFHFKSVRNEIEPLAVIIYPEMFRIMLVRLGPGDVSESLDAVQKVWNRVLPEYPFEYRFLEEDVTRMYQAETNMSHLVKYFTLLAIIIACLGIFGLSSFSAEQRVKEIGIRKVFGASETNLVLLLTGQFTKWVLISCFIAFPIAYYVLQQYLQNYAYRINLNVGTFLMAGILAMLVAIITVSFQSIKAALANPVDSLKYE
ncbi:MAG: ABC transporter permease [Candidatus Neomarinimicrobiota bacterium]